MAAPPRRVVYIIIDGMSTNALEQAIGSEGAPALAFLRQHSSYVRDSVAVFPTITPAATASLVTGEVPARHGIPGMCWYDRDAQRFVNYGQSPRAAVVEGVSQIVRDFIENLNTNHLSPQVSTIHEDLHDLGFTSASVNYMIFRGPYTHELQPNFLERLLFKKQLPKSIPGPKEHYFADIVNGPSEACTKLLSVRGVQKRIRATDGWAACVTRDLLEQNAAHMILFYLHENDHYSHEHGPQGQIHSLIEADAHIAHVLDGFDDWDQAVRDVGWVVTADHSQSPVSNERDHVVDLNEVLSNFKQVGYGKGQEPFKRNDIAIAGNGRVGFVYLHERRKDLLRDRVVEELAGHPSIDQVMWRENGGYVVQSARGTLRFTRAQGDEGVADERDNLWTYEGDLAAVGGVVDGRRVRCAEYPIAMWRIASALDLDRIGDVVVTPKLTYEFNDLAGGDHRGGGDHASLHAQDSVIPFMSTLGDPPAHPASVDVVPHIVDHFRKLAR
jgi:hypothetical protein